MVTLVGPAARFLALHDRGRPLLQPNAWDAGSARLLVSLGFEAIATTSSGFAATLGRLDGSVTRDEALAHASQLVAAVDVPVAADTENGFADDPAGVAETVGLACATGSPGARSRTSAVDRTTPSTTPAWRESGSPPRSKPPTGGRRSWCSPPAPRTTSMAATT